MLYNTYYQSLAELSASDVEKLEALDSCSDEAFVRELVESHFLVEDPENEADFMLYRQHGYRNNKKVFEITVSPTRVCNFHCDYCYILKRPGVMSDRVQDQLMEFIAYHYSQASFQKLKVNWYGGEPLLAIDVMERLSARMRAFCSDRGVEYFAHMLTNGSLADDEMCRRLVDNCGLITVMPTISGNGCMHDYQRCANDGPEHFDELMSNIDSMRHAGLLVHANFVVNRNNFDGCQELASTLCHKSNVVTRLTRTFAYGREGMVLKDGFDTPMELFERKDFGGEYVSFHRAQKLDAQGYRDVLAPTRLYCAAWVNRSFFIDEIGDVFACMIDMDHAEYALCNVSSYDGSSQSRASGAELDDGASAGRGESFNWKRFLDFQNLEPLHDASCRTCRILPICQGGCAYWRMLGDDVCHDLKDCIEDFVLDYYAACKREEGDGR